METTTILACSASAIAGGTVTWAWMKYVWPRRHDSYSWIYRHRPHRYVGRVAPVDLELHRDGYSLGYSFKHKCALWASFIVSEGSVGIDVDRGERFFADPDIPEKYRATPNDYDKTGFDKGHLAPSASIDFSRRSNDQTFAMSNVAPQDPELNRQAWGRLEGLIREWTKHKGKLAVVVGPVFGETNKRMNDIAIPKAFFQAVYSYQHDKAIGFFFQNKDTPTSKLWDCAMSIKELEDKTEYKILQKAGWVSKPSDKARTKVDIKWWQEKAPDPKT
jgi:endonuclease G